MPLSNQRHKSFVGNQHSKKTDCGMVFFETTLINFDAKSSLIDISSISIAAAQNWLLRLTVLSIIPQKALNMINPEQATLTVSALQ